MATVSAACSECKKDVGITTDDITVRLCADDNQGTYTFMCPLCNLISVKMADPQIVELLVASGVRLCSWRLPAELQEPHSGSVIDYDDLLDFHAAMHDDAAFQQAVQSLEGS